MNRKNLSKFSNRGIYVLTKDQYDNLDSLKNESIDKISNLYQSSSNKKIAQINACFLESKEKLGKFIKDIGLMEYYEIVLKEFVYEILFNLLYSEATNLSIDMSNKLVDIPAADCAEYNYELNDYFDSHVFQRLILTDDMMATFDMFYDFIKIQYAKLVSTYEEKKQCNTRSLLSTFYHGHITPFEELNKCNLHEAYLECARFIIAYMRIGIKYEQLGFFSERMELIAKWISDDCIINLNDIEEYNNKFMPDEDHKILDRYMEEKGINI